MNMLAVSLRQPVADLLVTGQMEAFAGYGRSKLRGRVAIHAGRGADDAGWASELWMRAPEQGAIAAEASKRLAACGHPTGAREDGCDLCARFDALLGSVQIIEGHPAGSCGGCSPWIDPSEPHWVVADAVEWEPMPAKGQPQPFPIEAPA